jgi:hypothetical protein
MGRPSGFSQQLADAICARLAVGDSVREICRDEEMPSISMVFRWIAEYDSFREQYARAKQAGVEAMAEEIIDIADNGSNDWMERNDKDNAGWLYNGEAARRSQIRIDARKWLLSKLAAKKYGDKLSVGGDPDAPLALQIIERRIVKP